MKEIVAGIKTVLTVQAEDIVFMAAVGADKGAHVLDHSEYWHVDLLEEVDASHRISKGEVLRC